MLKLGRVIFKELSRNGEMAQTSLPQSYGSYLMQQSRTWDSKPPEKSRTAVINLLKIIRSKII